MKGSVGRSVCPDAQARKKHRNEARDKRASNEARDKNSYRAWDRARVIELEIAKGFFFLFGN